MSEQQQATEVVTKQEVAEQVERIMTLGALQTLCEKPMSARLNIDGKTVDIPCRRLSPKESERIQLMIEEVAAQKPKDDAPKDQLLAFEKKVSAISRDAIAMTLYIGCPLYQQEKPGLTNATEVTDFVYSKLTETVINVIYQQITNGGIAVERLVNFT